VGCKFYSYLGDCDIFLTKCDLCVYSVMMAACISQAFNSASWVRGSRQHLRESWFVAKALKQWDERLPPHSGAWSVIEKGEIPVHICG
jgi:hypothetical protein